MRLQLLSDLHLETEAFEPEPAPSAELLVLAGDIDSSWAALERFRGWPVPVLLVAGNHEFDLRELTQAWPQLAERCARLGLRLLERDSVTLTDDRGRRVRFLGTVRWSDFDAFGPAGRAKALRAATYFMRVMRATRHDKVFDADAVREEALACRAWLRAALEAPEPRCDATVVITHFAPSLRSADPRRRRFAAARRPVAARPRALPPRLPGRARQRQHARRLQLAWAGRSGRGTRARSVADD
jgi:hypothetical protein